MELKPEQIQEALSANPELKKSVLSSLKDDVLNDVKSQGYVVRSKDEDLTYLQNYEKNIIPQKVEAEIGQKIKAVHDQYDADLFELLGEKKEGNEKTYDFMKRKVADLKAKVGKGNGDAVDKEQLKQLQDKLAEYKDFVSPTEVQKLKESLVKERLDLRLSTGLDKKAFAIPAHITDEKAKQDYTAMQRNMIKTDFLNRFTAKQNSEGQTVYYEGEKMLTNEADASPMTEEQIITKYYSVYLAPEKAPAKGAGSGNGGGGNNTDPAEADLKTKEQVVAYLDKKFAPKNIKQGNAEYTKEYSRIIQAYGITE